MGRVFTLEEAQDLVPRLKALTAPAFELASSLSEELQGLESVRDEGRAEELRERLQVLVESWAGMVRDLGPDVKGLWLVDFDAGDGCWCWAWPEERLEHWHGYETGFEARKHLEERA